MIFRTPPGRLERDNGNCKGTNTVQLFTSVSLATANCKPNEVQVPDVRGTLLVKAKARLLLQPLRTRVVWRPALPGERAGLVTGQKPLKGTLSAYDRVTLVVARGNGRLKKGVPASP